MSLIDGEPKQGYVMGWKDGNALVHYIGFSYFYDRPVKPSDLDVERQPPNILSAPKTKKKRQFRGIKNRGNTCFINSIFQALLALSPLTLYVSNRK